MPLRVRQQQRHPPRPAAQQPLLHAKLAARLLHVPEQVPGRVQAHVGRGVAGGRQAAAAVALVEQDDPELLRVKRPPVSRRAPHPGPPCTISAGTPSGFPQVSQYTRFYGVGGKTCRSRPGPGYCRQANCALWGIVITRLRNDPRTQAYMTRRLAEGRSKPEVIRILKRYVAREVYHHLPRP